MKLVREVLFLKLQKGCSNREIARMQSISKSTVGTYIARAEICKIDSIEKLNNIDDEKLKDFIFPHPIQASKDIKIDFEKITKELSRKNVTLRLLWKELSSERPESFYGYSRFCDLHREWRNFSRYMSPKYLCC